jgi:hypothetical protein
LHHQPAAEAAGSSLPRVLAALLLFGVSFGYVEATVVAYLRAQYEPLHQRLHPDRAPDDLFPLLRPDDLRAAGPPYVRLLAAELVREGATLVMLAAAALAGTGSFRAWFAAFLVAFGVWDVSFYIFLKVLLDWPASLLAWDLLFLLPVPWVAPVLAPALTALAMIGAGVSILGRESAGRPVRLRPLHWAAVVAGGMLQVTAFCWDYRNTLAGGDPNPFNWPLFVAGGVIGLGGFLHALGRVKTGGGPVACGAVNT